MHRGGIAELQEAVEKQIRLVAAADHDLRRAERAINQARTPAAADEAHRRADTALLAVEDAESELTRLQQRLRVVTRGGPLAHLPAPTHRGSTTQDVLFDVG